MAVFRVGQRVTLRERISWVNVPMTIRFDHGEASPKFGRVYEIAAIRTDCPACVAIKFPEFPYWFDADEFRPVVERKTDISIFQRMLTPNNERVSA